MLISCGRTHACLARTAGPFLPQAMRGLGRPAGEGCACVSHPLTHQARLACVRHLERHAPHCRVRGDLSGGRWRSVDGHFAGLASRARSSASTRPASSACSIARKATPHRVATVRALSAVPSSPSPTTSPNSRSIALSTSLAVSSRTSLETSGVRVPRLGSKPRRGVGGRTRPWRPSGDQGSCRAYRSLRDYRL